MRSDDSATNPPAEAGGNSIWQITIFDFEIE